VTDLQFLTRLLARTSIAHQCWSWEGAKGGGNQRGDQGGPYGKMRDTRGHMGYTHRLVFKLLRGPIPHGWVVHHLCENRLCCNPLHLHAMPSTHNGALAAHKTNKRQPMPLASEDPIL
jgi:hypothetical protein